MSKIPLGYVEFASHELKDRSCIVRMAGPATPTQGQPTGWQQIQRMNRISLTVYQGGPGWQLDIPVIFDGWRSGYSQEEGIRALEVLGGYMENEQRTPICTIDAGGGIPHDRTNSPTLRWVFNNIEWGDYITDENNKRVRQLATVTAWEYVPDTIVATKALPPTKKRPSTYRTKKGDTLQKIAAYFYGDQSKWHALARANHIRDPNHLKVKTLIRLPNLTSTKKSSSKGTK